MANPAAVEMAVPAWPVANKSYGLSAGHAGTAISTAAGLAMADQLRGEDRKTVAVVGDGSIVNGTALEGINNAAMLNRQFLIVLNDNSMSIDRSQGAMARTLDRIRMSEKYEEMRSSAENLLKTLPLGRELHRRLRSLRDGVRSTIHGGQLFDALGLAYFGPVDGHDIRKLIIILKRLSRLKRPAVLHLHTEKGRGCAYAVEDPCRFHSPSAWTVENGEPVFKAARRTWTEVFGDVLSEQARADDRVVAITAAMPDGTGLVKFRNEFPTRCFDVGISESHAVAMAGGLAKAGLRPVVAIYSTFMHRGMDQMFQEVALQRLPVILCMDRAGLVGSDGAVHHGFMDIAMLRPLPGLVLAAPADEAEMTAALTFALSQDEPVAIRYPRDEVPAPLPGPCPEFELGKSRTLREGADATLLCYGVTCEAALAAADLLQREEGLAVSVVNGRFAKPLDVVTISRLIASGKPLLVVEDHSVVGGFGSAVMELAASRGLDARNVRLLGMPDRFVAHASRQEQLTETGLDAANIIATVRDMVVRPQSSVLSPQVRRT
jgi:1-deoxy-D-xylulose-5-phosphate synthase